MVAQYIRGIGLITSTINGGQQYYLYNAHGDVTGLTNGSGIVTKSYRYDAFGNEKNPADADANPFRYCGEYFDKETGSIYLRARYYVPGLGRFTTQDPIRDGLNWYTYCGGNPIRFKDPTGLWNDEHGNWYPQNPNGTSTMGLTSYILYDQNMFLWPINGHLEQTMKAFKSFYGDDVRLVDTTGYDADKFIKWWNSLPNEQLGGIAIISHGFPSGLQLDRKSNLGFKTSRMSELDEKKVNSLFLFGCDTGNIDYSDNIAAQFVAKVGHNGLVFAPDGTRDYYPFGFTKIVNEGGFQRNVKNAGQNPREPHGYMAYYIYEGEPHVRQVVNPSAILTTETIFIYLRYYSRHYLD